MGPKNFYNTVDQRKLGTDLIASIQSDVDDLNEVVGDSSSGLVKDVTDLKITVGDENSGLVKAVADLEAVGIKGRKVYTEDFAQGATSIVFTVEDITADTLVDFYPDNDHPTLIPSAVAFDIANKTITFTISAAATAGAATIVVWEDSEE